jgi:hypothetical protein
LGNKKWEVTKLGSKKLESNKYGDTIVEDEGEIRRILFCFIRLDKENKST